MLVEDTWQHRGLGTALVRRVAETAVELGVGELTGTVPADEVRITRLLRRAGLRPTAVLADGTLRLNVPLETPGGDGLTRRRTYGGALRGARMRRWTRASQGRSAHVTTVRVVAQHELGAVPPVDVGAHVLAGEVAQHEQLDVAPVVDVAGG